MELESLNSDSLAYLKVSPVHWTWSAVFLHSSARRRVMSETLWRKWSEHWKKLRELRRLPAVLSSRPRPTSTTPATCCPRWVSRLLPVYSARGYLQLSARCAMTMKSYLILFPVRNMQVTCQMPVLCSGGVGDGRCWVKAFKCHPEAAEARTGCDAAEGQSCERYS